jgi:two-component system chemotaxis response regulator CheB
MPIRVLVVDDSRFFRKRITDILEADPNIKVVDSAENGREAVEKASSLQPDVITMDVEMPVMDGITAVRKIMQVNPIPILMFSSLTTDGARATLDALDAGAVDFIPKRFEDISSNSEEAKGLLRKRVLEIARKGQAIRPSRAPLSIPSISTPRAQARPATAPVARREMAHAPSPVTSRVRAKEISNIKLVAIGTSTGGPVALQTVLSALPADYPLPIVMVQHMPGTFTPAFAQRLDQICAISVKEAQTGDVLKPGLALLAPGGKQMWVTKRGANYVIKIDDGDPSLNYKPCVDITFSSIAEVFHGPTLAIILTGMGADGREGSRLLKQAGAMVWAQDEKSSVVYGMPFAVYDAGLTDKVLPLSDIGPALAQGV